MTDNNLQEKSVFAFIQARYNSERLPGKVLKDLCGKCILEWSIERARQIGSDVEVIVITGDAKDNQKIVNWCNEHDVKTFVGSENDVLNRFRKAAEAFKAETVVRLTADNPVFDYKAASALLTVHLAQDAQYCSNKTEVGSGYPKGIGIEIFSVGTLKKLDSMSLSDSHREHVNDYILENPEQFPQSFHLSISQDFSENSFTIDTQAEFECIESLIKEHPDSVNNSDYWRTVLGGCQEITR